MPEWGIPEKSIKMLALRSVGHSSQKLSAKKKLQSFSPCILPCIPKMSNGPKYHESKRFQSWGATCSKTTHATAQFTPRFQAKKEKLTISSTSEISPKFEKNWSNKAGDCLKKCLLFFAGLMGNTAMTRVWRSFGLQKQIWSLKLNRYDDRSKSTFLSDLQHCLPRSRGA